MSSRNDARVPYPKNGGTQTITFSGTSAAMTNAVSDQIRRVSLYADADCYIHFAQTPTATTADFFLPGSIQIMLAIHPGQKIAAIQSTAGGTLYVSEVDY